MVPSYLHLGTIGERHLTARRPSAAGILSLMPSLMRLGRALVLIAFQLRFASPANAQTLPSAGELLAKLADLDPVVRRRGIAEASRLPSVPLPVIRLITTLLGDRNGYVRSEAAEALGRMRPKPMTAVPRLLRCLDDADPIVHERCARALESIGHIPVEAANAVEDALTSPRRSVVARTLRIVSLVPQLPDTLLPALLKLMPEQEYVDDVIVALGNLAPCPPMAVRVLERLLALESKRSLVAPSLIKARPQSNRLLNTLLADLRAHDPVLRRRTVGWLALLGGHARPALGELRQVGRSDPDVRVRSAARRAIRRIVGKLR